MSINYEAAREAYLDFTIPSDCDGFSDEDLEVLTEQSDSVVNKALSGVLYTLGPDVGHSWLQKMLNDGALVRVETDV